MIDISPYIERLNWLKEWMSSDLFISLILFPKECEIWGCGILDTESGKFYKITNFEQFCIYKKSLTINTKR